MSLLTKFNRLSVKPFAKVPALDGLPSIERAAPSDSILSSRQGTDGGVDLTEGCLVTNTLKYTHQLVQWVNAVRNGDPFDVTEVMGDLCIGLPIPIWLNAQYNLNYLEAFIHASLDLYALIAITASAPTVNNLITMVSLDNDARQTQIDAFGAALERSLDLSVPSFTDPEFELVALHPEHFLPRGSVLTVYDPTTGTHKHYVAATDRQLRESFDPTSPRLPPFRQTTDRPEQLKTNIFLVILNAEIKFRRYFKMSPPTTPLPSDVLALMRRTIELVDLLYWKPVPTKGSQGEKLMATTLGDRRMNRARSGRSDPAKNIERGSSEEREIDEDEDEDERGPRMEDEESQFPSPTASRREKRRWFANADLETRKAYGRALMSGHDRDYDPALFEDAFPLTDPHLYSQPETVEAWQRAVTSTG